MSMRPQETIKNVRKYVIADNVDDYWKNMYIDVYGKQRGNNVYEHKYEAVKDIKIASINKSREMFDKMVDDPRFQMAVARQIQEHKNLTGFEKEGTTTDKFFRSIGIIGDASNAYFAYVTKQGYDGVADVFGRESGSKTATILIDPDESVKLTKSKNLYNSRPFVPFSL